MLPDNHNKTGEYAGAAIWGSSPSIDILRNHVYIATGNLYSVPLNISQCQAKENNQTIPTHSDECVEPDNHSESILALDVNSGNIKWFHQLGGYDVWFFACNNLPTPNCPPGLNPDADFGEAPLMLSINSNKTKLDVVAAVQKSGFAWALDRNNGNLIWSTVSCTAPLCHIHPIIKLHLLLFLRNLGKLIVIYSSLWYHIIKSLNH